VARGCLAEVLLPQYLVQQAFKTSTGRQRECLLGAGERDSSRQRRPSATAAGRTLWGGTWGQPRARGQSCRPIAASRQAASRRALSSLPCQADVSWPGATCANDQGAGYAQDSAQE